MTARKILVCVRKASDHRFVFELNSLKAVGKPIRTAILEFNAIMDLIKQYVLKGFVVMIEHNGLTADWSVHFPNLIVPTSSN